jgi:hypothetical protein
MGNPSNLHPHLFDLADQDRECLVRIRQRLEINSNALAVRLALRDLAKRLSEPDSKKPAEEGGEHGK